ncbi:hypothetical protein RHI9324_05450 [Rhizobium sp. CECT 9324]|nr:hypothetical protein RHI9324_05450 [Rhizobium sp. CECT 9324]
MSHPEGRLVLLLGLPKDEILGLHPRFHDTLGHRLKDIRRLEGLVNGPKESRVAVGFDLLRSHGRGVILLGVR